MVKVACLFSAWLVRRTRQIEPGCMLVCTCGRIWIVAYWLALPRGEPSARVKRGLVERSICHWYVPLAVSARFLLVSVAIDQPRRALSQPASSNARAGLGETSPDSVRMGVAMGATACAISMELTPVR